MVNRDIEALLKRTVDSNAQVTQAMRDNTEETQKVEQKLELSDRVIKRLKYIGFAIVAILVILVIVGIFLVSVVENSRQASRRNGEILAQVKAVLAQIDDCTTEGGKCKERTNQDTGKALAAIAAENQRQHDQLGEELRTGTTRPRSTTTQASPTTRTPGTSPGTTTTTRAGTSTTRPGTTTTTRPATTTTTTPSSTLVCVTVVGCV